MKVAGGNAAGLGSPFAPRSFFIWVQLRPFLPSVRFVMRVAAVRSTTS